MNKLYGQHSDKVVLFVFCIVLRNATLCGHGKWFAWLLDRCNVI